MDCLSLGETPQKLISNGFCQLNLSLLYPVMSSFKIRLFFHYIPTKSPYILFYEDVIYRANKAMYILKNRPIIPSYVLQMMSRDRRMRVRTVSFNC